MESTEAGMDAEVYANSLPGNVRSLFAYGPALFDAFLVQLEEDWKTIDEVVESTVQLEDGVLIWLLRI